MDNSTLNIRVNQIEEQLSNTLKGIDKLTEDVPVFREYAIENNKVVNGILRKLDDHAERMDKFGERMDKFLIEMAGKRKLVKRNSSERYN